LVRSGIAENASLFPRPAGSRPVSVPSAAPEGTARRQPCLCRSA